MRIQTLTEDQYPISLKEIPEPPRTLYLLGRIPDPTRYTYLTVVGARRHSEYGRRVCTALIEELAPYPVAIISGLALGIDAIAHRTALQHRLPTLAVLGSGLAEAVWYPRTNYALATDILKRGGGLLSELSPYTRAARHTFPARNRIMAGMSAATIVIECAEVSGTRITARLALEYNREVMAAPHPLFSETGAGTNALLREGAHLVRCGDDIASLLGIAPEKRVTGNKLDIASLTQPERSVYRALNEPKTTHTLVIATQLPLHAVQAAVTLLVAKGIVRESLGSIHRCRECETNAQSTLDAN